MRNPASANRQAATRNWWRVSLRAKGVAVLLVPMAALFLALFAVRWVEGDVRDADQSVVRFYGIRDALGEIRSSLLDVEAAVSAYAATRQPSFLSVLQRSRDSVSAALNTVAAELNSDADGTAALREIRSAVVDQWALLDRVRNGVAPIDREKAAMANLQARLALLNEREERLFTEARYQRDLARRRLFRTVILCGILGPLGALIIHLIVAGRMVRRLQMLQENARRLAHGEPLEPFPAGTDEIASLGAQLESAAFLLRERDRELRESERRYRDLFDRAPIPYEETDREGRVRRFNQAVCTLLRSTPDQITGRPAWHFLAPDRQEEARAAMLNRMQLREETGPFEWEYLLDDGTHLTVEIRESLICNDAGEVTGILRSLLDVTERNLAAVAARKVEQYAMELHNRNEQLARALEGARSATVAKSRFLASVSHELRTPLNGIIGFSELLYDRKLGDLSDDQVDVIGDILNSARHLLQLINDILDLSKVEAGRMEFRPERFRIQTLAFEVRDVIRPLAERKQIRLDVDVPGDFQARLDPGRFKQVLYNYLSNAVKFTPEHGSVTLRVYGEKDGWFRLEVEDSGIGIPADEIPRLFQEFAQLPNSRKADQGTGLGLALTRHIVEAQGGSVAVRSIPGQGSTFSAILPYDTAPAN